MNISFKKTKANKAYQDFVEKPSDRKKRRIFSKEFNESIADEAVKVHKRLKAYPTAGDYNKEYGQTLNAIELKKGEKQNDPLVLKTRITGSYRIFFNQILNKADRLLLTKEWTGDFNSIEDIYVVDVNNHKYD